MTQAEIIASLERRADALGTPLYVICQRAGVAPSTLYRWKGVGDAEPADMKLSTMTKIVAAVTAIEQERANA